MTTACQSPAALTKSRYTVLRRSAFTFIGTCMARAQKRMGLVVGFLAAVTGIGLWIAGYSLALVICMPCEWVMTQYVRARYFLVYRQKH